MAVRIFSIRTGLDAAPATPGSTGPDVSLTTPVIDAWAYTVAGRKRMHADTRRIAIKRCMRCLQLSRHAACVSYTLACRLGQRSTAAQAWQTSAWPLTTT